MAYSNRLLHSNHLAPLTLSEVSRVMLATADARRATPASPSAFTAQQARAYARTQVCKLKTKPASSDVHVKCEPLCQRNRMNACIRIARRYSLPTSRAVSDSCGRATAKNAAPATPRSLPAMLRDASRAIRGSCDDKLSAPRALRPLPAHTPRLAAVTACDIMS